MKARKSRKLPTVLSMMGTVVATAAAVYYKRQLELVGKDMVEVSPDMMIDVREEGALLHFWIDDDGGHHWMTSGHNGKPACLPEHFVRSEK